MLIEEPTYLFDPALPSTKILVVSPVFDDWYDYAVVTSRLLEKLPSVKPDGHGHVTISSGMTVRLPFIELGVQVGSLRINRLVAHVADSGSYDLVLGTEILKYAFRVGSDAKGVETTSDVKDDPEALAIELYPVGSPFDLADLDTFLHHLRLMNAVACSSIIADVEVPLEDARRLNAFERDLPDRYHLKVTWVDHGSIWLTIKSSSAAALKYVARFFNRGAQAKLAQEVSAAQEAETRAQILDATRDETIGRVKAEEEALTAENIAKTHEAWRQNVLRELQFQDEVIGHVTNSQTREALLRARDESLRALLERRIFPMVRNLPRPYEPPDGVLLLGPSTRDEEDA